MLRSLSTAITGLRNNQNKLDVVGNNIANVNTVGYKYTTARFQDIFSQTLRGATAPQAGSGGVNPMQVGLGTNFSSADTIHSPGPITRTGRDTDLAIEGNGYFVVSDGEQYYYTRDGSFVRDSSGTLVSANGLLLMGWLPVVGEDGREVIDTTQSLSRINIPLGEDTIAAATTWINFTGNLNAELLAGAISGLRMDEEAGLFDLQTAGLQYGDYQLITDAELAADGATADIRQFYVQGETDWLTDDLTVADDTMHNASILVEVTGKTGNNITFKLTSYEYNAVTGAQQKATLEITRDVETASALFEDPAAARTIGNIVFEGGSGTLSDDPEDYAVGDKYIIGLTAAASDGDDGIQLGYDSPQETGYDVTTGWVFRDGVLNNKTTNLRFYSLDSLGRVYDNALKLGVDELADTAGDHITFSVVSAPYVYPTYFYDSLGNRHDVDIVFAKDSTAVNTWTYKVVHQGGIQLDGDEGTLVFQSDGRFNPDASVIPVIRFDPGTGARAIMVEPDFNALTQRVLGSNVIAREQDGFAAGELVAFNVEATGEVTGSYTNGMIRTLGLVAMATFFNPEGLLKCGNNLYDTSANSGEARIGRPGEHGNGAIISQSLEMSNVDLANEFTEMITTSRAYQANSRVISTSDEVLLELINIKR